MAGELAKVIIRGYELADENSQQGEPTAEFTAMFNPETFSVTNEIEYDDSQAESETGSEFKFKNITAREFSFDFVIDATGANVIKRGIEGEVEQFKRATGFKELEGFTGNERRSFYLTITWGSFNIRCVLKGMDINYSLFRPDGTPIRATISAKFNEYKTTDQQSRENPESVVNLTQVRDVFDQDQIGNLATKLYGDGSKYIDIAKANTLNNLKELANGTRLEFPPIDQLGGELSQQASSLVDQASQIVQGTLDVAQGKNQLVQSITDLAQSAAQQAESALSQAQSFGQLAQEEIEALVQQGEDFASQLGNQTNNLINPLLSQGQDAFNQLNGGLGANPLQSVQDEITDTFEDITQFFDF